MKILLIEDDQVKSKDILTILAELKIESIKQTTSFNHSKKVIRTEAFDVVLLDMSLPLFDAESDSQDFETFGGLGLLDELDRVGFETKVFVITAFDILGDGKKQKSLKDLDKEMGSKYASIYGGTIHYDATSNQWRLLLKKHLLEVINRRGDLNENTSSRR